MLRPATAEDIPFLAALITDLGYPSTVAEMEARMAAILPLPHYHTTIALQDGIICGLIGFLKIFFWEQNGFYVKVQSLVVKSSHRRYGIGSLLMKACEDWARGHDARLITLNSGNRAEREAAHRFYPGIGFTHTSSGYTKILE